MAARTLRELLRQLGYRERDCVFQHPSRRAIFLGDFSRPWPAPGGSAGFVRCFHDKDGNWHDRIRVRWWGQEAVTYRPAFMGPQSVRGRNPDAVLSRPIEPYSHRHRPSSSVTTGWAASPGRSRTTSPASTTGWPDEPAACDILCREFGLSWVLRMFFLMAAITTSIDLGGR